MCLCFGTIEQCTSFARSMGFGLPSPLPPAPVGGFVFAEVSTAADVEVISGMVHRQGSVSGDSSIVGRMQGGDSQQLATPPRSEVYLEDGEFFNDPRAKQVCFGKGKHTTTTNKHKIDEKIRAIEMSIQDTAATLQHHEGLLAHAISGLDLALSHSLHSSDFVPIAASDLH